MTRQQLRDTQLQMQISIKELALGCGVHRDTMGKVINGKYGREDFAKVILAKAEKYLNSRRWKCVDCGYISDQKGYCPECDGHTWVKYYVQKND